MSRKKFIKSLMGAGIDRNVAASVAATAQAKRMPYIKAEGLFLNTYAMLLHGQDPSILYTPYGGGGNA